MGTFPGAVRQGRPWSTYARRISTWRGLGRIMPLEIERFVTEDELPRVITASQYVTREDLSSGPLRDLGPEVARRNAPREYRIVPPPRDPNLMYFEVRRPSFWDDILAELLELICASSRKYAGLRNKIGSVTGSQGVVGTIAAVFAEKFGVSVGLTSTILATMLLTTLQVGRQVFCRRYRTEKKIK